jgi:prophage antirepressor-like protein
MNEIKIFENPEFGKVRTIVINGEPWFVARDLCEVLNITYSGNRFDAVPGEWKGVTSVVTPGGAQQMKTLTEQGLYFFLSRSDSSKAIHFQKWISGEVLPSIRKTGQYSIVKDLSNIPNFRNPSEAARAWADQYDRADKAEEILSKEKPKIEFYNAVAGSKGAVEMSAVAKLLDKKIGRNNLFQILREKRILRENNEPYQEYIDRGWFRVVEQKYTTPTGEIKINIKPLVYQKGIEKINRMLEA